MKEKGHLIIHDVTLKEAKKLMKKIKKEADFWTNENVAKLDSAATFAMLTHGFAKTEPPIPINKKLCV